MTAREWLDLMIGERGLRYLVTATITDNEYAARYALTYEAAEQATNDFVDQGYTNVAVHTPQQ